MLTTPWFLLLQPETRALLILTNSDQNQEEAMPKISLGKTQSCYTEKTQTHSQFRSVVPYASQKLSCKLISSGVRSISGDGTKVSDALLMTKKTKAPKGTDKAMIIHTCHLKGFRYIMFWKLNGVSEQQPEAWKCPHNEPFLHLCDNTKELKEKNKKIHFQQAEGHNALACLVSCDAKVYNSWDFQEKGVCATGKSGFLLKAQPWRTHDNAQNRFCIEGLNWDSVSGESTAMENPEQCNQIHSSFPVLYLTLA